MCQSYAKATVTYYLPQLALADLPRKTAFFLFFFFSIGAKAQGLKNWLEIISKSTALSTRCQPQGPDAACVGQALNSE